MITKLLKDDFEIEIGKKELVKQFKKEYPYYEKWIEEKRNEFESGKRVIYQLTDESNIVGYAMVNYTSKITSKINGIFIYPQFFNKGYATIAIISIIEELSKQNYEYLMIQTRASNSKVIHLFDKIGFQVVGKKVHHIEKQDNIVACYDLLNNKTIDQLIEEASKEYEGFSN